MSDPVCPVCGGMTTESESSDGPIWECAKCGIAGLDSPTITVDIPMPARSRHFVIPGGKAPKVGKHCCRMNDDGTECGQAAVFQVGFTMRVDMHHPPSHVLTGLGVCAEHKSRIEADNFVTTDGWEFLMQEYDKAAKQRPLKRYTELTFQEIERS